MKIFSVLLILFSINSFAFYKKEIVVAVSLKDCVVGALSMYEVYKKLNKPNLTILLKKELESDSLLINKKLGLQNYQNAKVIYSNTLFDKYNKGIKSTISVVENDSIIYSDYLYKLDTQKFSEIYLRKDKNCFEKIKSGVSFIQDDLSLIIHNKEVGRLSYYDPIIELDIIPDEDWVLKAYKIIYRNANELNTNYNKYQKNVEEYPTLIPEINKAFKLNNHQLILLTSVYFFNYNEELEEEIPDERLFLFYYNIKNNKVETVKYLNGNNKELNDKYYINSFEFHSFDNKYIIPLVSDNYDNSNQHKYLSIFKENPNNSEELILDNILESNIPNNYLKYNLLHNFQAYRFSNSLALLFYGEFIYDFKNNIKYNIPLPENEFKLLSNVYQSQIDGKISSYVIDDIYDNLNTILIVYRNSKKELKLMEIDKKSNDKIKDEVLMNENELKLIPNSWFSFVSNGDIYYLNKDKCITKIYSNKIK